MINLESRFAKDPAVVFRKIGGECLLVPIRHNVADLECIYVLNETAATIWELIDGQRSVRELKEMLLAEFEVSPAAAEADLIEILMQLQEVGGIKAV